MSLVDKALTISNKTEGTNEHGQTTIKVPQDRKMTPMLLQKSLVIENLRSVPSP